MEFYLVWFWVTGLADVFFSIIWWLYFKNFLERGSYLCSILRFFFRCSIIYVAYIIYAFHYFLFKLFNKWIQCLPTTMVTVKFLFAFLKKFSFLAVSIVLCCSAFLFNTSCFLAISTVLCRSAFCLADLVSWQCPLFRTFIIVSSVAQVYLTYPFFLFQ